MFDRFSLSLAPQLVVPTERDASYPPDLPRSVSVQTSEMVATNTRHHPSCGRTHLQALLTAFQQEAFFCSSSGHAFPRGGPSPSDQGPSFDLLHPAFWRHAQERDTPLNGVYAGTGGPAALSGHALRPAAAADVWALHFAQFWVDYEGKGRRPQPFVDSFPLAVWACQPGGAPPPRPEASLSRSGSEEALGRLQRKRLLKEYYSTEGGAEPGAGPAPPPSNGLQEPRDPASADVHVLVHVQKHLSAQVGSARR